MIINKRCSIVIINQVKQCPSGALRYYMNAEGDKAAETLETKVEVLENGSLLVYGTLRLTYKDGSTETKIKPRHFVDVVLQEINLFVTALMFLTNLKSKRRLKKSTSTID
ncbi:hypothetical protein [Flavivirga jejuensis]|uniref:Uncharacterized protein n=1 Tax=Flavivirga jejuensis TaxID=870487 RepID=A0ABT8WUD2_9FLAO|nr:hypothetical protein [Flavivirga jejuensis]MDO5976798.1 hypothetical protein [Flavivirga jejuensis]